MAHRKALGSAKVNRDSAGQRLGVKIFGGQKAQPGSIIVRQRGTKIRPGINVGTGKDHTIFSKIEGIVQFKSRKVTSFTSAKKGVKIVSVVGK